MGFFSWDCKACGHSVRATNATRAASAWLAEAVLVEPDGSTLRGTYDGYGRLETRSGREVELGEGLEPPCLYHTACYDLVGKPSYDEPSFSARDQGFFVGEYDPAKPHSKEDVAALAKFAKDRAEEERREARAALAKMREEYLAEGKELPLWLQA